MSSPTTVEVESKSTTNSEQVTEQPQAESCSTAESTSGQKKDQPNLLLDLPRDILYMILLTLARDDYSSLYLLSLTCRTLRKECQKFMKLHPHHRFRKIQCRPAGMSESSEDDYDDVDGESDIYSQDYDDNPGCLEDMEDFFDRMSFGSNCDLDLLEAWRRSGGAPSDSDSGSDIVDGPEHEGNIDQANDGNADESQELW